MSLKVYKVDATRYATTFNVDGIDIAVDFFGGASKPVRRPALFSTDNRKLQKAIESSYLFNSVIFLHDVINSEGSIEYVEPKNDTDNQEYLADYSDVDTSEFEVVPEVTSYQQAKEYLLGLEGVKYKDVSKKEQIIEVAKKHKIMFPNLK